MSDSPSKFVWYDLMTSDLKAAETFYTTVVGWEAKDSGMPDRAYSILSMGATMVGGIMPIPPEQAAMGARPMWTGYVGVPDVDDYAARVVTAGGTVCKAPEDIPGIGRFAVVADPHGATFILFSGMGAQAPEDNSAAPGHIGWNELPAGNLDAEFAFYSGLFGWTKAGEHDMGPMGIYLMFATGGGPIGGMMTKPPEFPVSAWVYYFNVESTDAAVERIKKAGGQVAMGPHQVPTGQWIVQAFDPQGALFALVAPAR